MAFKNLEQRFNEKVSDLYAGSQYRFPSGLATPTDPRDPTSRDDDDGERSQTSSTDSPFPPRPRTTLARLFRQSLIERAIPYRRPLYAGAKSKFDGGRESTGITDDPLMVVGPGESRFGIKYESRSIPFSSAPRDVIRLTLFSLSVRGIAFLAKQQLLQTGNTFAQTRIINPAFVVGNAVPFLHIRRNLRPITGKFGIASSRDSVRANARLLGQLQPATLDTMKAKYNLGGNVGNPGIRDRLKSGLRSLVQPFTDTISAFTAPRDVGEKFGRSTPGDNVGWDKSRPEIGTITNLTLNQRLIYQKNTNDFFTDITGGDIEQQPFLKYFSPNTILQGPRNLDPRSDDNIELAESVQQDRSATNPESSISSINQAVSGSLNARDLALNPDGTRKKISYVRDPLNTEIDRQYARTLSRYYNLPNAGLTGNEPVTDTSGNKIDPILVSFAMGNDSHVQFRAFIRDINQSANPEYKTYQYVGRIEKFVSYVTVQREVNFKLDIISFSKDEIEVVWNRINYLTGLVFPYGINRGLLQPNIVRFTIGKMFEDQPAYVTSFSTSFNEISESWDIDRGVPIAATVNIGLNIIEKKTMTANSGFYRISEEL